MESAKQKLIEGSQIDQFRARGEAEFARRESEHLKIKALSTSGLNEEQRLALNHRVIELGGLMVKHGFDEFPRSAVLGVLMMDRME